MQLDRKLLPSISMLASFDAAARSGSVSEAAKELNVTHGAVSRQIHALENQLGVKLFRRSPRGLELTDVGKRYAGEVRSVIGTLQSASLKIVTDPKGCTIDLAVLPTFGTRWLIPRLPDFLDRHPEITVNFVSLVGLAPNAASGIDVAISYDRSSWPGAESEFLIGQRAIPVCSPSMLTGKDEDSPSLLQRLPLLALRSRPRAWADWFAQGSMAFPVDNVTMECEQVAALTQAAVAGLGVALLPPFLISAELERRQLVQLSSRPTDWQIGYHLVTPRSRSDYKPVVAFREWLFTKVAGEALSDGHAEPDAIG
jgi:DNA-binding transcriptional LysR family regulator